MTLAELISIKLWRTNLVLTWVFFFLNNCILLKIVKNFKKYLPCPILRGVRKSRRISIPNIKSTAISENIISRLILLNSSKPSLNGKTILIQTNEIIHKRVFHISIPTPLGFSHYSVKYKKLTFSFLKAIKASLLISLNSPSDIFYEEYLALPLGF